MLAAALFQLPATASAQAVDASGDWRVTGKAGGRLAMHLGRTSTFDNVDQGQMGVAARMSVERRRVTVVIGPENLRFEGDLSPDGQKLTGQFTPGNAQTFAFERGVFSPFIATPETEAVSGDWHGVLTAGPAGIRVAMHLGATSRFDSVDEGANGIIAHMTVAGRRVTVDVPRISAVFEGDLSEDGAQLVGEWRQATQSIPLSLERGTIAPPKRTQTPVAPFPYRAEEVGYDNAQRPGVHLAGTLTIPEGRGLFPAVLLITGSGREDRNETGMGHQPFLVIADYLSRRGFAVLRVDDRGVGGSRGASRNDTSADYATDVEAGVAYLRTRPDIDRARIGLLGHSEGGLIAPIVASRDPLLGGIIMMAGPGVSGADVMVEQARAIMLSTNAPADQVEAAVALRRTVMDALASAPDDAAARTAVMAAMNGSVLMQGMPAPQLDAQVAAFATPWYRAFAAYDPAPTLRSLRVPVLALLGDKDVQVVARQNAPALRAALAGNAHASVVVLEGFNHMFQKATTGAIGEYVKIEETVDPVALATMGDWLTQTLKPSAAARVR